MQEFIPLEDDWGVLDGLEIDRLVPYQVGRRCLHRARLPDTTPEPARFVPEDNNGSGQISKY